MECKNLFIVPVWAVWGLGIWGVLNIVNAALELYVNAQKRKLEKLRSNNGA